MQEKEITNYRWYICGLLFFATTVNYLDRAVISLLKPYLTEQYHWTSGDYANLEATFKMAYALGMLGVGGLIDKLGTRLGYALSTFLWSVSAVCHAVVNSTFGFGVARFFLGVTEAGNFPAAIKTTAEWFPKRERAFATGIFNSGATVGAIIAPLSVPFIAETLSWRWAFVITGSVGFIWLILWLTSYKPPSQHKKLSQAEYDYIHSDIDDLAAVAVSQKSSTNWLSLLRFRQTWAFVLGKFLTDPIWWFYLFWLPDFLEKQYHLKGTEISLPVALVYVLSAIGSVSGGWLPLYLIKKNYPVYRARKTSMFIYAICVMPIVFAQVLGNVNMWLAVLIIGLAAAAHQAWSANIFTTVSDMFPKAAVASVTGMGGMSGTLGSVLLTLLVQKQLFVYYESIGQLQTAYYIMFFICGSAYLIGWLVMHWIVPKFEPVNWSV